MHEVFYKCIDYPLQNNFFHDNYQVLDRTRIKMPAEIGRQMLGVMDETGTLEYGEVFVQYSPVIAAPGVKQSASLS